MGKCKHHHHDEQGHVHSHHGDFFTKSSAVIGLASTAISVTCWVAGQLDAYAGFKSDILGMSYYGLATGLLFAAVGSSGEIISHYTLNTNHQEADTHHHHYHAVHHDDISDDSIQAFDTIDSDLDEKEDEVSLTWLQRFALVGDLIAHTGDTAGPLSFIYENTLESMAPRWTTIAVQSGLTLVGAFGSIAEVRTCRNAMLNANAQRRHGM